MRTRRWRLRCSAAILGVLCAAPAAAQTVGTFRWQLQPFCNVVTLTVNQAGSAYVVTGGDDRCGTGPAAAVAGLASAQADGTVAFVLTIDAREHSTPLHLSARIALSTLGGTWRDSSGWEGGFVFAPAVVTGSPRERNPYPALFLAGLSAGGERINGVGLPVNGDDAAPKAYVDDVVGSATWRVETALESRVSEQLTAAFSGPTLIATGAGAWQASGTGEAVMSRNAASTRVTRQTPGSAVFVMHPSVPVLRHGQALALTAAEFCYAASPGASVATIEIDTITAGDGIGVRMIRQSDLTARTGAACRTYTLLAPYVLTAADSVAVVVQVTWTAGLADVDLGRVTLRLQPATPSAP